MTTSPRTRLAARDRGHLRPHRWQEPLSGRSSAARSQSTSHQFDVVSPTLRSRSRKNSSFALQKSPCFGRSYGRWRVHLQDLQATGDHRVPVARRCKYLHTRQVYGEPTQDARGSPRDGRDVLGLLRTLFRASDGQPAVILGTLPAHRHPKRAVNPSRHMLRSGDRTRRWRGPKRLGSHALPAYCVDLEQTLRTSRPS